MGHSATQARASAEGRQITDCRSRAAEAEANKARNAAQSQFVPVSFPLWTRIPALEPGRDLADRHSLNFALVVWLYCKIPAHLTHDNVLYVTLTFLLSAVPSQHANAPASPGGCMF